MQKDERVQLVQKQLDAYNRRDLETFCACFHREIKVSSALDGLRYQGIEKFTEQYREMFNASPNLHCELKSRIVVESAVVDEEWVTGNSRFPKGAHAVAIYGFRDGLIDRVVFVF